MSSGAQGDPEKKASPCGGWGVHARPAWGRQVLTAQSMIHVAKGEHLGLEQQKRGFVCMLHVTVARLGLGALGGRESHQHALKCQRQTHTMFGMRQIGCRQSERTNCNREHVPPPLAISPPFVRPVPPDSSQSSAIVNGDSVMTQSPQKLDS